MTTEDDFQTALDANPADWQTRLVFADWLQDRNDPRAIGYRALGVLRLCPFYAPGDPLCWWTTIAIDCVPKQGVHAAGCTLDRDWLVAFDLPGDDVFRPLQGNKPTCSRREAEDAAALAFTKLPAERQAELLASPVTELPPAKPRTKRRRK